MIHGKRKQNVRYHCSGFNSFHEFAVAVVHHDHTIGILGLNKEKEQDVTESSASSSEQHNNVMSSSPRPWVERREMMQRWADRARVRDVL